MTAEHYMTDIVHQVLPMVAGDWERLDIDAELGDGEPDIVVAYVDAQSRATRPLPEIPALSEPLLGLVALCKDDGRGECCRCQLAVSREGSTDIRLEYRDEAD